MSSKRSERWQWAGLTLMLVALCAWNINKSYALKQDVANRTLATDQLRTSAVGQLDTMIKAQASSTEQEGKILQWPEGMEKIIGEGEPADFGGHSVVLYFSELSCNTCLDSETQFINSLVDVTGGDGVRIVAHATNPRYVRNYARLNAVQSLLYFDEDNRFGELNKVTETPMVFLLNDRGEVVSAHYPLPENPEWSEAFHNQILRMFGFM
ncbi:MAG: hypothetical protein AAF560_31255 [Acidobacteriota bacterium]